MKGTENNFKKWVNEMKEDIYDLNKTILSIIRPKIQYSIRVQNSNS